MPNLPPLPSIVRAPLATLALVLFAALAAALILAQPASAATKEVAVTPTLKVIKGNANPLQCFANVVAEWQAWETASGWRMEWAYNGFPKRASVLGAPNFHDNDYAIHGLGPVAGNHWYTLARFSRSTLEPNPTPTCPEGETNKSLITGATLFITVEDDDPGPDDPPGDDDGPGDGRTPPGDDPDKPPPPPPPDKWPFDARRLSETAVDCAPGSKARDPYVCTALVSDADPADPDASAPTGRVVWFAPTGKLSSPTRCTLQQTSATSSSCTATYKPSSKTLKDPKQPVQGGYQGSKIHRPSSGLDGGRAVPQPTGWGNNKRSVSLSLSCPSGQTCKGNAEIKAGAQGGKSSASAAKKKRARKVGSARYRIDPGATKRVKIKLNGKGRKMLKKAKRSLRAELVLTPAGQKGLSDKVSVKLLK